MRRLRFAFALCALGFATSPGSLFADDSDLCPNAFQAPGWGTCQMTGRVWGCICEYDCDGYDGWVNFCQT
ncbi:MAG TPA: hypothetical protein VF178_00090 [Gemmatimonadaceae bacterium]